MMSCNDVTRRQERRTFVNSLILPMIVAFMVSDCGHKRARASPPRDMYCGFCGVIVELDVVNFRQDAELFRDYS